MPEGELLGNHSAHGQPQEMAPLNLQHVEQAREVVGHICDEVRVAGVRAATRVPVVENDHLELCGQGGTWASVQSDES